jgi:hypothetical protein
MNSLRTSEFAITSDNVKPEIGRPPRLVSVYIKEDQLEYLEEEGDRHSELISYPIQLTVSLEPSRNLFLG